MMTNLFSMFDPSLSVFSFSWVVFFFFLFFLPFLYWPNSFFYSLLLLVLYNFKKEVDYVLNYPMKGVYSFFCSVFMVVSMFNFFAIFPFIFSVTSHLCVTLPLSYSLWLGIIFFCVYSSIVGFLSHLVPVGTPLFLMSFMVLVEVLSNLIRPIALTFRLTANMVAGHLLMALIGNSVLALPLIGFLMGVLAQSLLITMELGVCFVQSYVFSTLLLLYLSDSEH